MPDVHYVTSHERSVAYQSWGTGDRTLLFMSEWFTHVDGQWDEPAMARTLERLGSFARVVTIDKRGVGLAGPVDLDALPTLAGWADDIVAVLDEVESGPVWIIASGASGPLGLTLCADPRVEVERLALLGSSARYRVAPDYEIGLADDVLDLAPALTRSLWGSGQMIELGAPERSVDAATREWFARYERQSASPDVAEAMQRFIVDIDVRPLLADIDVPTIVFHRTGNQAVPVSHGRYLATELPDAGLVELTGDSHLCFGDSPKEWIDEVRAFFTGSRTHDVDRRVMTVLFTDIVGSTGLAAELGDERWTEVLERHDAVARAEVAAHGGRIVKHEGDGLLAHFTSPSDAINAAARMQRALDPIGVEARAGLHVGEVEINGDDLAGITVHIGARVAALADGNEIFVSRTVHDMLIGSTHRFEARGEHTLKGVPGTWEVFAVSP